MPNYVLPRKFLDQLDKRTNTAITAKSPAYLARVVGRRSDGRSTLQPLGGTCARVSSSGSNVSNNIGDVGLFSQSREYSSPVIGGSGGNSVIIGGDNPFLIKQTPKLLDVPTSLFPVTTFVVYTGIGFTSTFNIVYLKLEMYWANPNVPEVHDSITVTDIIVVSSIEATANVHVTPDPQWAVNPYDLIPLCGPVRWNP